MELRTYWRILIRRWWLVITPVLVVVAHVASTYTRPAPFFQVVMRFAAGTEPAGVSADYDRYYPWLASEYIANGLADLAETHVFAQAISSRLAEKGFELATSAIESAIVTDNAQSILVVYLTWFDDTQAVAIAEAVVAELAENSAAYYPQLADIGPAVRVLDPPVARPVAPSLRTQLLEPAIRIGLAVAVGAALAFLWHYLDPTVSEAAELEALGLPVLARIPRK